MHLNIAIKRSINKSVLCWLATVNEHGIPNVSPKEIFTHFRKNSIIIANIASPQTVQNIKQNNQVCVSFIDVLVQKGYQIKGKARLVQNGNEHYKEMHELLTGFTKGKFPIKSIIDISIEKVKPILAPSYTIYPETTEQELINSAKQMYGI